MVYMERYQDVVCKTIHFESAAKMLKTIST